MPALQSCLNFLIICLLINLSMSLCPIRVEGALEKRICVCESCRVHGSAWIAHHLFSKLWLIEWLWKRNVFHFRGELCSSGSLVKFSTLLIEKAHLQVPVTKQCYLAFSNGYMHSLKWLPSCNTSEEEWISPGRGPFVFLLGYIMKSTLGLNFMWNNSMCLFLLFMLNSYSCRWQFQTFSAFAASYD